MNTITPTDLLAQIARIQFMERGKLSAYHFKNRSTRTGPYYMLQCWENGKNLTRHVRSEQVPLLEEALAGHARFQALVQQYAQSVIDQTRQQLAGVGSKKKASPRRSSWPKSRKSSS